MKAENTIYSRWRLILLVGMTCGIAWAWLWAAAPDWTGLLFGTVFLVCAADIVIADWEIMIVPDRSVAGIFISGWLERLASTSWESGEILGRPALEHGARSLILGGGAWLLAWLYRLVRGREGLGLGDVKLMGAAGAWLPVGLALDAITLAAVGALAALGALALTGGARTSLSQQIPFAVFLAPAFWLAWAAAR